MKGLKGCRPFLKDEAKFEDQKSNQTFQIIL